MNFTDNQNLYLGISEKKDGPMMNSSDNRLLFFKNRGLADKIIIMAGLVHGNKVAIIKDGDKNETITGYDALITDNPKYLLALTVADCLPIYFYDKNKKVIALAHAGWRGVVSKIVEEVIAQFINHYGSGAGDIEVFIGPHIKDCHFEVKSDVANRFKPADSIERNGKIFINLSLIVKRQLIEYGVSGNNINISQECTYCLSDGYFSFRRDHPEKLETMVAYISLK